MVETYKRFDIYLVSLNPTIGSEMQKTRPCIIISPDEMHALSTVIIAPMTSKGFAFLFRPKIHFENKEGLVVLDQIRAVDKSRLIKRLGTVEKTTAKQIADTLVEMFTF